VPLFWAAKRPKMATQGRLRAQKGRKAPKGAKKGPLGAPPPPPGGGGVRAPKGPKRPKPSPGATGSLGFSTFLGPFGRPKAGQKDPKTSRNQGSRGRPGPVLALLGPKRAQKWYIWAPGPGSKPRDGHIYRAPEGPGKRAEKGAKGPKTTLL